MFSISALSKQTGVKIATIRYYEQIDLLPKPTRTLGNQRRYDKKVFSLLSFIKHARDLGFTVHSIRELIQLSDQPDTSCQQVNRIAKENLCTVRDKMVRLNKLEQELARMVKGCDEKTVSECYVIQSLSDHLLCHEDH